MAPLFLLLAAMLQPATTGHQDVPAIVVSARYPSSVALERIRTDLPALRAAGYNAVAVKVTWREGEPQRGVYNLLPLDQLVAVASSAGLGVRVEVVTSLEPEWKKDGTNALAGQFFDYVRRRFGPRPGVLAVLPATDAGSPRHHTITIANGALSLRAARLEFWSAFASGIRSFEVTCAEGITRDLLAFGETVGVVTRNVALFAPLQARKDVSISVSPAERGGVSVAALESAQAIVIVARNSADAVRRVSIAFPRDVPEAIWQNMEHGNSVHFVISESGPVLHHEFAAQDVLVLAIRKTLR